MAGLAAVRTPSQRRLGDGRLDGVRAPPLRRSPRKALARLDSGVDRDGRACPSIPSVPQPNEAEQHHRPRRRFRHDAAGQREHPVKRRDGSIRRRHVTDDVRADAQPVWVEHRIAGPLLQVANESPGAARDRSRRRQPKEVAVGVRDLDLRHEEVVTSREIEGGAERHVELHFFARDLAVAPGGLAPVRDGCRRVAPC